MAKSESHKRAQAKAAGRNGQTEVPLQGGRRLDAQSASGHRATEIERSGTKQGLEAACRRLKASGATQHVLQVPQQDMKKACEAMRKTGTTGSVKNMCGSKRRSV